MPQTRAKSTTGFGIELPPGQTFVPGYTIRGNVYREHRVSSSPTHNECVVSISLHGRAKSKVIEKDSDSGNTYRGRLSLIDDSKTRQILQHPTHATLGDKTELLQWPFAITIPTHADKSTFPRKLDWKEEDSFLSLDAKLVSEEVLPPSFKSETETNMANVYAFIEYFLKADLAVQDGVAMPRTATLPIRIMRYHSGPPIADNEPKAEHHQVSVATQRLLPGMQGAKLSFSQKLKDFSRHSSVPQLSFNLEVTLPSVWQFDGREPGIPLYLRAIPLWVESDERIRNIPQVVKLTKLEIHLQDITETRSDAKKRERGLGFFNRTFITVPEIARSFEIPLTMSELDKGQGSGVGRLITCMLLQRSEVWEDSDSPLTPDTMTWNIKHWHQIKYKMTCEVAGKAVKVAGEQHLVLLPPSM